MIEDCENNNRSDNLQEWRERSGRLSVMLGNGIKSYHPLFIASPAVFLFLGHERYVRIRSASNSPNPR